jgi:iron complex outermembrane recepter protein
MQRAGELICGWSLALWITGAAAAGALESARDPDLTELSLEELMAVRVTSVSRREERLFEAAGAVFVLTREDLRRSGARNLPEALRLVPGLHVAQINGSQWVVSARGFSDRFANKLLVLVDGRSVYTHLFSGVFWEDLDIPLSEVERIEIVRGPGGALWGANAVNGVINILTRRPQPTPGGTVDLGVETGEQWIAAAGEGAWGAHGAYRVWGAANEAEALARSDGGSAHDDRRSLRGGVRIDRRLAQGELTFDAGVRDLQAGQVTALPSIGPSLNEVFDDSLSMGGGHSLLRWTRRGPAGATSRLQVYYDQVHREELISDITVRTLDVDYQSFVPLGRNHELVWGGEGRRYMDDLRTVAPYFTFAAERRTVNLWSLFFQDQVSLAGGRLHLTVGSKAEHEDLGGWNLMPSVRAQVELARDQIGWASVSRSTRTPGRAEADIAEVWLATVPSPAGLPVRIVIEGERHLDTEELVAWEIGYRAHPGTAVSLDLSIFHNEYEHVIASCRGDLVFASTPVPHLEQHFRVCNAGTAEGTGLEAALSWAPSARWRWSLAYSYLDFATDIPENLIPWNGSSPGHTAQLRLQGDPLPGWESDLALYYTESLPAQKAPTLLRLDVRLERELRPGLGLEIAGRNLLDGRHREFGTSRVGGIESEVRRSAGVALHWRF